MISDLSKVVSCGMGTNSIALIIGLYERGIRPHYIVFVDTGCEKPWTYEYIDIFDNWLGSVGFPLVTRISGACTPRTISDGSLENELLRLRTLPSKVFGLGACSAKWKIRPFEKWAKQACLTDPALKYIGFDADEPERMDKAQKEKGWVKKYPLIEWWWGRSECISAIQRVGLPLPGKSACFFCPSSKKHEIFSLPPDLLHRALRLEEFAINRGHLKEVKGLGRDWSWSNLVRQGSLFNFSDPPSVHCNCYDG